MKSGSLGKLTTRPNTWELLYNNSIDTVCTFDIYITNKENRQTAIDLLITPIPIHLLPAHEADYLLTSKLIEPLSTYDKKGIVIGEFDYVYVRSQITVCVVSVNGFIDELANDIGTTAYYHLVSEGGRSSSGSNTANFVLITENVADATNVPYTISDISLSRIQSIFVNGVSKTVSLTGDFVTNKNYSVLKVVLVDNVLTDDGEKITVTSNGLSVSKSVNVRQPVITTTYNLIPSTTVVEEGDSITLNLLTTNVVNGSEFFVRTKPLTGSVSGALIGTYTVGTNPLGITYDPTNNAIWAVNASSNNVTKLNAATGALIGTYTVGATPYGITYDPTNNAVWTCSASSNNVTKLNAATGALIGTYTVGNAPRDITYDPTNNAVWVANSSSNNVTKLDAATGTLIGTYTVGNAPYGITYDPTNNAIWAVNYNSNNVTKLNAATGTLIGTYTVGTNPLGITYDPTNNAIWAVNYNSNNVTKLNAGYFVASSNDIIDLNTLTNKFSVINNYGFLSIPVISDSDNEVREKIVFEVLDKDSRLVATSPVINLVDRFSITN